MLKELQKKCKEKGGDVLAELEDQTDIKMFPEFFRTQLVRATSGD